MIGSCAELVSLVAIACPGITPDEVMDMHLPRALQLRSIGLMRQNVRLKPAGGGTLRRQAEEILGDSLAEWLGEE